MIALNQNKTCNGDDRDDDHHHDDGGAVIVTGKNSSGSAITNKASPTPCNRCGSYHKKS